MSKLPVRDRKSRAHQDFQSGKSSQISSSKSKDHNTFHRTTSATKLLRQSIIVRNSTSRDTSNGLGPSFNPVRISIERAPTRVPSNKGFIIHYSRKDQSHLVIDSLHEAYYGKYGLPMTPRYIPAGRRFSGSSSSDPDYNQTEFERLRKQLNSSDGGAKAKRSKKSKSKSRSKHASGPEVNTSEENSDSDSSKKSCCLCCCKRRGKDQPSQNDSSSGRGSKVSPEEGSGS